MDVFDGDEDVTVVVVLTGAFNVKVAEFRKFPPLHPVVLQTRTVQVPVVVVPVVAKDRLKVVGTDAGTVSVVLGGVSTVEDGLSH